MRRLQWWLSGCACCGMLLGPSAGGWAAPPNDSSSPIAITTPTAPKSAKLDLKYIPSSAVALAVIRPQSLFTGPNAEWMPLEVITAAGLEHLGVDPLDIEEAIGVTAAEMGPQPEMGLIVRFTKPYNKEAVLAKLAGRTAPATVKGKAIQKSPNASEPSFYLEDPTTIVVASESMLTKMIAAPEEDSPLRKLAGSMDFSSEFTLVASVDAVRDQLKAVLAHAPPMPPAIQPFLKLPDLLSAILVRLNVSDNGKLMLTLKARDEASAVEVEQIVKQGMESGRQMIQTQVASQMRGGADPTQAAMAKYLARVTNLSFDKLQPVRRGTLVTTSVPTTAGAPATIGILMALLLPAIQSARAAAQRVQSANNLKQIVLALLSYESSNRKFPAHAIFDKQGKPLLSWRVAILPYIEEDALYKQFHLDEAWDSEHNKPLIAHMPRIYMKPASNQAVEARSGMTVYLAPVGKGLAFEGDQGLRIADFADGSSNTIIVVEANDDHAVAWTKPDDLEVDLTKPMIGLGASQPNGFQAAFVDGHVMNIPATIPAATLKAIFTRNGGEPVNWNGE